ncbi:bifunctional (p)ppGpp synthetase/guanosine-3',5'-bis(diphosphate) 3'-pyrophosphohydrolase [Campylobacter hominis]|uniref:RelA/SpoT family protein n=1 Tax=Campylobacter hominis TaxID=76517 RepID=UPI0023F07E04|nr:RelA/SpoT family protein [Campylobacter hominis]MDD7421811.1 RelA/SpoT family protein [Campylobacter hominis]MDY3116430.1 RelA/SpoT family protein [Campylobacter hominis]
MDLKNRQINDDYLEHLIDDIVETNDIEGAKKLFYQIEQPTPLLVNAIQLCIRQHDGQFRKSGEPYAIHPILVSCIVAFLGGDDDMIIAALLHDVVEDTDYTLDKIIDEFGEGVAKLVEGLTKIVTIRDDKLAHSNEATSKLKATALTFRKMLLVSIEDVRVLVVKLCDRLHNMLTLGALRPDKQVRIAQETLLVYAPIAHRLGISAIKNFLEDLSFKYVMPHEYEKIDKYLTENKQQLWMNLNAFSTKISELLLTNGFTYDSFKIQKRLKHYYSIYLKMQRKGISIEEVLDLLAVRIIVKEPEDCYLVLGIIHMKFNPLISRFKDYVALPKQNGYQTIHTTVFNENMIIEAQIRTFDMHQTAEYGVAAHWKYKYNGSINPKLDWLSDIGIKEDDDVENLYEYAKDSLYVEDIAVYSPKGGIFTLPRGATALDYAYEIHSEVGLRATQAYVNRIRVPLLTELKNGDIVHIITGNEPHYRCSWLNSVKTGKAKATIKSFCKQKLHDINQEVALNMLCAIFSARKKTIKNWLENENLIKKFSRIAYDSVYLKDVVNALKKYPKKEKLFFFMDKYEIKKQKFDNIVVYSNFNVSSVEFDYCCNPKRGDDIMGFRNGHDVSVHHKFCERALNLMRNGNENIFVKWTRIAPYRYKIILSIENKRGSLASFLAYLAKLDVDLVSIKISENSEKSVDYFEMTIELNENLNSNDIKEKLKNKYKIIEFTSLNDAYKN